MKLNTALPWILFMAITMAATFFFFNRPTPDTSGYERQKYIDSLEIVYLNDSIHLLTDELAQKKTEYDTIEKVRIVYRDKFDTEAAEQVINDESVDSTCRKLLSDCTQLNERNELAISKLKAINTGNEALVKKLRVKNSAYEKQLARKEEYIANQDKQHKKEIRKTKILAGLIIGGVIVLAAIIK